MRIRRYSLYIIYDINKWGEMWQGDFPRHKILMDKLTYNKIAFKINHFYDE